MKKNIIRIFLSLLKWMLVAFAIGFTLLPIYLAIINSFKSNGEIFTNVLSFPSKISFENYIDAFVRTRYLESLTNTIILVVISLTGIVLFSSMAGYKLSRTKTRLSKFLFTVFVISMLIPFHSMMIGLVKVSNTLNVSGSIYGLGIIYIGLGVPMAIFLYHGFSKSIPKEIEDAARIDGCSEWQLYFRVVFPLQLPITATVIVINGLWIWNDFLLPMLMLTKRENYTIVLSTKMLFGEYTSDWSKILALLILALLPVILGYIFLQKFIVKGISDGAIK